MALFPKGVHPFLTTSDVPREWFIIACKHCVEGGYLDVFNQLSNHFQRSI